MVEKGVAFMFETSAKENQNVELVFREAAKQVIRNRLVRGGKGKGEEEMEGGGGGRLSKEVTGGGEKKKCC